jgi:lysine decarboxylase
LGIDLLSPDPNLCSRLISRTLVRVTPTTTPWTLTDPQTATPYADAIAAYADRDWVRLDVPGHQASAHAQPGLVDYFGHRTLSLDVPPLTDGIDYGDHPTPLMRSARLAAQAWGARKTWFLTNGASKGNLVTNLALRGLGTEVVVQRSVHSSVIDGLALAGLDAYFAFPSIDPELGIAHGVTADELDHRLTEHPDAVAAYVVTPSYFGAVADVRALADVAHAHGVPLVVDEAWGSHFGFHPELPTNALRLGADIVISSTHKLAGSLTQSAMLHLGDGPFAGRLEPLIDRAFRSMQSTSASALLMSSLDLARRQLAVNGQVTIGATIEAANKIRGRIEAEGRFRDASARIAEYADVFALDPLRIVIDTRVGGISGHEARALLFAEHGIHLEMSTDAVVVAVLGAGAQPDVDRLVDALHALPNRDAAEGRRIQLPPHGARATSVRDAYFAASEVIPAEQAIGRISADTLAAYPPGIPNLLPGEVISREVVEFLQATVAAPYGHVRGAVAGDLSVLRVVAE